jgi:serine/threonine protein kinase
MNLLAQGPVATVYTALHAGQPVALKVFPAELDRRTLAAVEGERPKLGALASILPVDGIDQWDGRHALRMELCAESLAARVQRLGALSSHDVLVLGHALSSALAAAHEAGVLHGGVSPDNVLYRASGEPVLADFGVPLREAFPRDPLHAIECVSPETLRTGLVTEQTDLYGLGAVLHFALTGESPHPGRLGEQPGERVLRVLGSPVPAINRLDVPIRLSTVVARLLAAEPAHRPREAASVAAQLVAMLPQPPVVVGKPPQNTTESPRPRFRHLLAGGAVLAGLVAVALAVASRQDRAEPPVPTSAPQVTIELAEPVDQNDYVVLNWSSARTLDFSVVVASAGEPDRYVLAERRRTARIAIAPERKYCFRIRGADGGQVYESQPKPVRGAVC